MSNLGYLGKTEKSCWGLERLLKGLVKGFGAHTRGGLQILLSVCGMFFSECEVSLDRCGRISTDAIGRAPVDVSECRPARTTPVIRRRPGK